MRKIFNIFKRGIIEGSNLFVNEASLTFINIITTLVIAFSLWGLVFTFYFSNSLKDYLQNRLDFSIYFKNNITSEEIEKIQKIISSFPGVKKVTLITQEMAFEKLQKESQVNPVIERALKELKTNPLVDYLVVEAENSEVYLKISDYLLKSPFNSKIDYLSYFENKKIIERAISFSNNLKILMLGVILVVCLFSVLIIFNTIYISFYSLKEEIEILQLLGASNWFIRLPFLFYVFYFTFVGYVLFLGLFIIFLEKTKNFWSLIISNFSPYFFVLDNFFPLNFYIFSFIILLNLISAFLVLQKYFKV
ncbi:Cell division protein FtsX [bacterium HR35]|nr:Cell division protein FtsX [bacterium HR35]